MDFSEQKKIKQADFKRLAKKIQNLIERRDKIEKALELSVPILRVNCPHKKTAIRHWYVPGSYLDKSEDHEITYCTVCGTELKDKVSYGWYG